MLKVIVLLKRNPGLSPEQFRERYEGVHAPLGKKLFPFMRKYVRRYVTAAPFSPAGTEPKFDCITEEWLDDMEAFKRMLDIYVSEAGRPIREDEKQTFDMTKMEYFFVEEVT